MDTDGGVRTMLSIGKAIEEWCKQYNIKQQELADVLQVSTMTIRRLWHGEKCLTAREINRMSRLMGEPYEFFIPDDEFLEEDFYFESIRKRCGSSSETVTYKKPKQCDENETLDRRLSVAVKKIETVEDAEQKLQIVRQVEFAAQLADWKICKAK